MSASTASTGRLPSSSADRLACFNSSFIETPKLVGRSLPLDETTGDDWDSLQPACRGLRHRLSERGQATARRIGLATMFTYYLHRWNFTSRLVVRLEGADSSFRCVHSEVFERLRFSHSD